MLLLPGGFSGTHTSPTPRSITPVDWKSWGFPWLVGAPARAGSSQKVVASRCVAMCMLQQTAALQVLARPAGFAPPHTPPRFISGTCCVAPTSHPIALHSSIPIHEEMRRSKRGSEGVGPPNDAVQVADVASTQRKRPRQQQRKGPKSNADRHAALDEHVRQTRPRRAVRNNQAVCITICGAVFPPSASLFQFVACPIARCCPRIYH